MHKFLLTTVAAATVGLLASGANAADDTKHQVASNASFASLDRNGDHRISRSEAGFDRVLSQTFAEIDTDGDGFVSAAEFAAAEKTRTTVSKLTDR